MFYSDNGGPTAETSSRNEPLRGFKGQMYEGGIRVPFVMQWKGKIPAGQTFTQPVMGFDCHATALAAAKVAAGSLRGSAAAAPDSAKAETTLDGIDLLPHLLGEKTTPPHEFLCWRAGAQRAIRLGDWKLIQTPRDATAQLFNLKTDISETTDLAAKEPAKFAELAAKFTEWEKGTQPAKWVRQDQRNAEPGGKLKAGAPSASRRRTTRVDDAFKTADKNNDGKLTREEYPQQEVFDGVDANKDGAATLEEVRAYYQQRRGTPKQ
jgi:arylsulfatase A-like enzyme